MKDLGKCLQTSGRSLPGFTGFTGTGVLVTVLETTYHRIRRPRPPRYRDRKSAGIYG
jgi:hypothetical protein